MQFDVKEEEVKKALMDAIMNDGIGKALTEAVSKALDYDKYNSPLKDEVDKVVREQVRQVIDDEHKSRLYDTISEKLKIILTDDNIGEVAESAVRSLKNKTEW